MLLSRATGSVSSGNLSVFDVTGSKVREIAGDDIITGNEERCPWKHRNLKYKLRCQSSVSPNSTDNRSMKEFTCFALNMNDFSYRQFFVFFLNI